MTFKIFLRFRMEHAGHEIKARPASSLTLIKRSRREMRDQKLFGARCAFSFLVLNRSALHLHFYCSLTDNLCRRFTSFEIRDFWHRNYVLMTKELLKEFSRNRKSINSLKNRKFSIRNFFI